MLTEQATVIEVESLRVKVAVKSASGCGSCTAKAGCGTGILDRWLNPTHIFWVELNKQIESTPRPGDILQIGVEEDAFVRNTFFLYLLPLLVFLVGAGIGLVVAGEAGSIFVGIAGLLLGAFFANYLIKRSPYARNFSPQILDASATSIGEVSLANLNAGSVNNS